MKLISLIILHVSQRILAECQDCIPRKLLYRDKSRYKTLHYDTRNASKPLLTLQIGNFLLTHIYIYTMFHSTVLLRRERKRNKRGSGMGASERVSETNTNPHSSSSSIAKWIARMEAWTWSSSPPHATFPREKSNIPGQTTIYWKSLWMEGGNYRCS